VTRWRVPHHPGHRKPLPRVGARTTIATGESQTLHAARHPPRDAIRSRPALPAPHALPLPHAVARRRKRAPRTKPRGEYPAKHAQSKTGRVALRTRCHTGVVGPLMTVE